MNPARKALLDLVKIGATGECLFGSDLLVADWNEIYGMACKQGVACVAWHGIEILYQHGVDVCPSEVKLQWYARADQQMTSVKKKADLSEAFASAMMPLKLVVLKGMDYARYWPVSSWRDFSDLDVVAVVGSEFTPGISVALDKKAREVGLKVDDDDYKHSHITFNGLTVENHHCFTGFAGSKEGKLLEKELRRLFAGGLISLEGSSMSLPSVNFTAVFMLAHAQNHFFSEGMALKHILDWHFFLQGESENVNWNLVKPILEKTGMMSFAVLLTQFCNRNFRLQFEMGSECSDELLEKFTEELFAQQINPHDRRWHKMLQRMWQRFVKNVRFAELNKMSVWSSLWKWIAYASFFHRKPELR